MLRLITNSGRYTKIVDLHSQANIEPINEYINNISKKFYKNTLTHKNPLIQNITKIRKNNTTYNLKHPLPYQHLPIFNDNFVSANMQ